MKTFTAATALVVALLAAASASAQDVRVPFGDLNLSTPEGAARFDQRVRRAARNHCGGRSPLAQALCVAQLKAEIHALLPAPRRDEYARGRSGRQLAMVPTYYG